MTARASMSLAGAGLVAALALNVGWEIAHLPLYTLNSDPDRRRVLVYLAHCILGDGLMAGFGYLAVAALLRSMRWPLYRPAIGGALWVVLSVAYTTYSEWANVYRDAHWAYSELMPTVAGIGLSPLLQWVAVPVFLTLWLRWWLIGAARRTRAGRRLV